MTRVKLAAIPEAGADLEDYVAALFQASGHFVEKNLVERVPSEVLELDLVATDYMSADKTGSVLAEVKGGKWGYPDLFKVVGWMKYLDIERAAFLTKGGFDKDIEDVEARMARFGLSVVSFDDFSSAGDRFTEAGLGAGNAPDLVPVWRFSYRIERRLTDLLLKRKKSLPDSGGPAAALEYHRLVNDGVFFEPTVLGRLERLYDAYKDHPRLTLAAALEMDGESFDPHTPLVRSVKLQDAMRTCEHPFLHACMYVEHRARLALLKAAVDYCCTQPPTQPRGDDANIDWNDLLWATLPQTFRSGVAWLKEQRTYWRYAVLWQQFLWGWGGFYLDDRAEAEFAWMAEYSGVPVDEIPVALEAFDRFFPIEGGWFVTPGWTCAKRLLMMPAYFHGLGAHHRFRQYGLKKSFSELNSSGYTVSDLVRWNNATVEFLQ